jgi:hypothetical protein
MHLGLTAPANLLRVSRTRAGIAAAGAARPALRRPHRYVDINSYEHRPVHTLDAIQPAWTHFRQPVVQMASLGGRTNLDLVLRQVGCVPALGVSISSTRMRSANPLLEGAFGILEVRLFLYK